MMHENIIAILLQAHNWKNRNSFYKELNDKVKSLNEIAKIFPTTKEMDNKFFIEGITEFLAKQSIKFMKHEQEPDDIKLLSADYLTPTTISEMEFRQLQILYFQFNQDIEFFNYKLDISDISPEDFESCKDFFAKYKDECLMDLSNYKEITEKIIKPLKIMEENYGSWEAFKKDATKGN